MNEIAFPDLSKMIRVMLSIPPSTGWIERAYSVLENMSEEVEPVRSWITEAPIFFLAVLKLPVRDNIGYLKELEFCK